MLRYQSELEKTLSTMADSIQCNFLVQTLPTFSNMAWTPKLTNCIGSTLVYRLAEAAEH